jgi:hypothetical protein
MKPNTKFDLTVKDIEYIEYALRLNLSYANDKDKRVINELLGKIHNQKNWYRPKEKYVSG